MYKYFRNGLLILFVIILIIGFVGIAAADPCPAQTDFPSTNTVYAHFSINGNKETYLLDTTNQPIGSEILELCVYPSPDFSGLPTSNLEVLYMDWSIDHPENSGYFGFPKRSGTQLPINGATNIPIGSAIYNTIPTDRIFLVHFYAPDCGMESCWRQVSGTPTPHPSSPPTQPLCPVAIATGTTSIDLSWWASADDIGVAGYKIFRSIDNQSFYYLATTTGITYTDTGLTTDVTYYYAIEAFDVDGNPSLPSDIVYATPRDMQAPIVTVPDDMIVEATSANGAIVTFTATATDDIDPDPVIECSHASGSQFPLGYTTVTCTATDDRGNVGSDIFTILVVDTKPPTPPSGLTAAAIDSSRIDLSWTASYDAVGITQYRIYRSLDNVSFIAVSVVPGTENSYQNNGLSASTKYYYYVVAYDRAGHFSDKSNSADATTYSPPPDPTPTVTSTPLPNGTPDPTPTATPLPSVDMPPIVTVPPDITAEAGSPSGAPVIFSGVYAFDNEDKANKTVTCNPVSGYTFPLGTTIVECWAQDSAGNIGSNTFAVTVVDTTPPTAPLGLTATAISSSGIDLSWTASYDAVGVNQYRIYRSSSPFVVIGTVPGSTTAFSNTGLMANTTYYYYIIASDMAGNSSGPSNTATAKTLVQPPSPPPTPEPTPGPTSTPDPSPTPTPNPCLPPGNTPRGQIIETVPTSDLNIKFDAVLQCGDTTAVAYYNNQWETLPRNYVSNLYYNIDTTATYINYISIDIIYSDSNIPRGVDEETLRIFHYENGLWIDSTVALDTTMNRISGRVTSLSPFAVAGTSSGSGGGSSGRTVFGSSFGIVGFMILGLSLLIISILSLRKNNK